MEIQGEETGEEWRLEVPNAEQFQPLRTGRLRSSFRTASVH